ncbi:MAG: hypothetical protein Q4D14_07325, partial [Bacteroidales bacterium]|nr:hypothetical protein [Bacteroidales bacterium]
CFYYDETLDEQGRVVYETTKRKIVSDLYLENGHTYLTGQILVDNRKHVFDPETGLQTDESSHDSIGSYPFLEIDGVIKDITPKDSRVKKIHVFRGMRFYHDGKKLYTILGGDIEYHTFPWGDRQYIDYYIIEDGGEPYYISSYGYWGAYDIAKVGDDWYVVGECGGRPAYQMASEYGSTIFLGPITNDNGAIMDVTDHNGEPYMVGKRQGAPFTYYRDSISYLKLDTTLRSGTALFVKKIDGDIYIGGEIDDKPVLWKNGKVKMHLQTLPENFNNLYCTDVEVSGGKLYVATEGLYIPNQTTHVAFFTFDDADYIDDYDHDKYDNENLVTSVEIMKEDPNANTFQNVEYVPNGSYGGRMSRGYQHISQTRILLKY